MPMIPFIERFPELGARETRSVLVTGRKELPDGDYGFIELYCDEPGCDCRRVMIDVLRQDTGWNKIWATINYGWESLDFYRTWGGPFIDPVELKGPFLDLLNPQTSYSPALLDLFQLLLRSEGYVQRLRRHYEMFRVTVEERYHGRNAPSPRVAHRDHHPRHPWRRRKRQHVERDRIK